MTIDGRPMRARDEASALGHEGVEKAVWYTGALWRRVNAELKRLGAILGPRVGDAILHVVTPEVVDEWLAGTAQTQGADVAQEIREFGAGPEGLVWPGNRADTALLYALNGSEVFSGLLCQTPGPWQIFYVIHFVQNGLPCNAVAPFNVLTQQPDIAA